MLRRVYLSDLLGAEHLGFNARLARLIILDQVQAAAEARALAAQRDSTPDPLETLDLIETIPVYQFPQLTREEIRAMLHLPVTDVKKTRSYQEAYGEGREEGQLGLGHPFVQASWVPRSDARRRPHAWVRRLQSAPGEGGLQSAARARSGD